MLEPIRLAHPRWAAAVIEHGKAYVMGDPRNGVRTHALPHGTMSDPGALLDLASRTGFAPEITIVVDRVPIHEFDGGDPRPVPEQLAELAQRAAERGWTTSAAGIELGSGWITWSKDKSTPVVHMAIRRLLTDAQDHDLIHPGDDPERIVERLVRYARLMHAAYRATPGVSGLGALRNLFDRPVMSKGPNGKGAAKWAVRPEPKFIWHGAPLDVTGAGDVIWRRRPSAEERQMRNVFAFDTRAAYLAAAAGAKLGWHEPKNTGAIEWDPSQSGLYRIRARGAVWADASRCVPIVSPARINSDGTTWVAAPILALLSELGYALPEVIDSWTCAGTGGRDIRGDIVGRYLSDWADKIRDALPDANTAGDPYLRLAVKRSYSQAIGLMARPGGRVYRRDWAATIQDEARARLLRRIYRHHEYNGTWPIQVKTDCVWYATDTDDHVAFGALLGEGPRIGHLRYDTDNSGTMAAYLDKDAQQQRARRERRG